MLVSRQFGSQLLRFSVAHLVGAGCLMLFSYHPSVPGSFSMVRRPLLPAPFSGLPTAWSRNRLANQFAHADPLEPIFCPMLLFCTEMLVIPTRSAISCQHSASRPRASSMGARHRSIPRLTVRTQMGHSPRRSLPKLVRSARCS